ncbi:c-type cytochrome [Candidatus Accumulibacter phosphatis]|uniref:c-type cytochrome n=1 Tax=Candidatus Accumulibacter phosphatis TaxID=327160 RepID=UPI003C6C48D0
MSGEIDSGAPREQAASHGTVFRALLATSVAFLVAAIAWSTWQSTPPLIDADDARLLAIGQRVYAEHCASCHGANLEGQPA